MVAVRTVGGRPVFGGPRALVVDANTSWAQVSTAGWQENGCPITHYSVSYRLLSQNTWVVGEDYVTSS